MLSKSQISFIKSLHQKKFRNEHNLFIIEGIKSITELFNSKYCIHSIYGISQQLAQVQKYFANIKLFEVNNAELGKISTLKMPQGILALVHIPTQTPLDYTSLQGQFSLVLDTIQDPGNLGTIIRTADWFGIKTIICSPDTVEIYNPKTVQSTMGSLNRVRLYYTELGSFLSNCQLPVFGALLNGKSIYQTHWGKEGLILLGNEGHGIRAELIKKINVPVTVPQFGGAESLNVAVAAAVFCSELARTTKDIKTT